MMESRTVEMTSAIVLRSSSLGASSLAEIDMAGIYGAYDIRGRYPQELDEERAQKIAAAFVRYLKVKTVVVGRDARASSPFLADAFIEGAMRAGAMVTDIGLVTTPQLYFAAMYGRFGAAAMVTASHLSGNFNGLKLTRENAIPLSGLSDLPAIEKLAREKLPEDTGQGMYWRADLLDTYIGQLMRFVEPGRKPLKVLFDARGGTAGIEAEKLFARTPSWRLIGMNMDPRRDIGPEADPLPARNTEQLQHRILQHGADIGIAFDADGDRVVFLDEKGRRIPSDIIMAMIAPRLLDKDKGAAVIYDLRAGRIVPETIESAGGRPVRTRIGHAFIKEWMRSQQAIFGGEMSGHYYFAKTGYADNGMLAMIHMLNLLSSAQEPLSELAAPFRKYHSTGEINLEVGSPDIVVAGLAVKFAGEEIDRTDGFSLTTETWWCNVRAAQTESALRLNLEAVDGATMERKLAELLAAIRDIDPAMMVK